MTRRSTSIDKAGVPLTSNPLTIKCERISILKGIDKQFRPPWESISAGLADQTRTATLPNSQDQWKGNRSNPKFRFLLIFAPLIAIYNSKELTIPSSGNDLASTRFPTDFDSGLPGTFDAELTRFSVRHSDRECISIFLRSQTCYSQSKKFTFLIAKRSNETGMTDCRWNSLVRSFPVIDGNGHILGPVNERPQEWPEAVVVLWSECDVIKTFRKSPGLTAVLVRITRTAILISITSISISIMTCKSFV
jgi:hypothetical protein